MSAALNEFREISFLLYKIAKPDQYDTMNELLIRIQVLLEAQESHNGCCESPSIRIQRTPPLMPMTPPRDLVPSFGEDLRPPTPPTLVITPDHEVPPTVVVTKEPDQSKTVKVSEPANVVVSVPTPVHPPSANIVSVAEEEDEDSAIIADLQEVDDEPEAEEAAEEEADAAEEVAEEEEEAEEAEEEEEAEEAEEEEADVEEDYDVEKIGKRRYFVGQTTRKVYERIDAETIGEYLGFLRDGKIVPN